MKSEKSLMLLLFPVIQDLRLKVVQGFPCLITERSCLDLLIMNLNMLHSSSTVFAMLDCKRAVKREGENPIGNGHLVTSSYGDSL